MKILMAMIKRGRREIFFKKGVKVTQIKCESKMGE